MKLKILSAFALVFLALSLVSASIPQQIILGDTDQPSVARGPAGPAGQTPWVVDGLNVRYNTGNVTTTNWFKGLFDIFINIPSQPYLAFNGSHMDFNETKLNETIVLVANSNFLLKTGDNATGNYIFDGNMNTTGNHSVGDTLKVGDGDIFFEGGSMIFR